MRRFISKSLALILVLCMLASIFVGCKQDDDKTNTEPVSTFYLTVPAEADDDCLEAAEAISFKLANLGYQVVRKTDAEEALPADAYEILVGKVNREKATEALAQAGNLGWAIVKDGSKLYFNATQSQLLRFAVGALDQNAFKTNTDPYAAIADTVKSYDNDMIYLFNNGVSKISVHGDRSNGTIYTVTEDLTANLRKLTGIEVSTNASADVIVEFVLADYGQDISHYNAYTIKAEGNKITIASGTTKGIFLALDEFYQFVKTFVSFESTKNVCFPANVTWMESVEKSLPVLPCLKRAELYEGAVAGSYVVALENAKYSQYTDYVALLEQEGYVLREERVSDFEYVEGDTTNFTPNYKGDADNTRQNIYRTYTNSKYLAYVYFCEGSQTIRIVANPIEEYNDFVELNAQADSYTPSTDSFFAMLDIGGQNAANPSMTYVHGMCLVVKLDDGRFIVVDGGNWVESDREASEVTRLYNWMKSKSDNGKVVIAAWLFTHAHSDHISVAWKFSQQYRNDESVEIQRYLYNFPTYEYAQPIANTTLVTSYYDTWYPRITNLVKGHEVVHTGQIYKFANCTIEILFTHEDFYPRKINSFNNSSTIFKFTIDGKSFLVVGDLEEPGQIQAAKQCGTLLDSDYFQVAHHGWNGDINFHRYAMHSKAKIVLHPRQNGEFATSKPGIVWLLENASKIYSTKDGITVIPCS